MKKIIIIILAILASCFSLYSQDVDFYLGKKTYELKTAKSRSDILLSTRLWIAENVEYPQIAIKMNDDANGIIVFRYNFPTIDANLEYISFTPSVTVRVVASDNLCVLKISNATCHVDKSYVVDRLLMNESTQMQLTEARRQLEWLNELCVEEFNSTMDWNMLNDYISIRDRYKYINEHTERARDKACNETKYSILQGALASYALTTSNFIKSLISSVL